MTAATRYYFYSFPHRTSVAMDITEDGEIFAALAFCRPTDPWAKKESLINNRMNARGILDGRLNLIQDMIDRGQRPGPDSAIEKFVFRFSKLYRGKNTLKEVWYPFLDKFREEILGYWGDEPNTWRWVDTIVEDVAELSWKFKPKKLPFKKKAYKTKIKAKKS
jgi:hypothetical protein